MLSRPEIRSCYRVEVVDENVFLLDERRSHLLSGSAFRVLTPLLDGSKTTAEIIEAVSASVSAAEVFYALGRLEDLDVLREGHAGLPQPDAAFWDSLGADAATALHRLRAARVAVTALEGVAAEPLIAALSGLGISAAGEDAGDLQVVLTSDYLQEGLADINQRQLQEGRAWLLAKPVGSILWIGPLLDPGRTGCWECLAQRLRSNRNVESFVQARKGPSRALLDPAPALPSTQLAAAGFLATAVAQWLAQAPGFSLAGTLVTVDLTSFATERHTLVRRPQCPVCGEGAAWALRTPEALRLESRRSISRARTPRRSTTRCFTSDPASADAAAERERPISRRVRAPSVNPSSATAASFRATRFASGPASPRSRRPFTRTSAWGTAKPSMPGAGNGTETTASDSSGCRCRSTSRPRSNGPLSGR